MYFPGSPIARACPLKFLSDGWPLKEDHSKEKQLLCQARRALCAAVSFG